MQSRGARSIITCLLHHLGGRRCRCPAILVAISVTLGISSASLASSVTPTRVPIDSVWLDHAPQVGVPFLIHANYHVHVPGVDSLMLRAYYVSRWKEQEVLGEVRKVVPAQFPDTLGSSLSLTIGEPGEFMLHFWVLAWTSRDTTGVPWGANEVLKVSIPPTGTGTIVQEFSPRRRDSGAGAASERQSPTPPKFVPRDSSGSPRDSSGSPPGPLDRNRLQSSASSTGFYVYGYGEFRDTSNVNQSFGPATFRPAAYTLIEAWEFHRQVSVTVRIPVALRYAHTHRGESCLP